MSITLEQALNQHSTYDVRRCAMKLDVLPSSHRKDVWLLMLGVARRSGKNLEGDEILDNQDELKEELSEYSSDEVVVAKAERLLTHFCIRRGIPTFPVGFKLSRLAVMLITHLDFDSEEDTFNCFYAFVNRYLPPIGNIDPRILGISCSLFRLLLLYHAPKLGVRFDKIGLDNAEFIKTWLASVFLCFDVDETILRLFDHVIVTGDAVFLYYICIALVSSAVNIMECQSSQDMLVILETHGSSTLKSAQSIADLLQNAHKIADSTPNSFRAMVSKAHSSRRQLDSDLYNATRGSACLALNVEEALTSKHLLIDTRPIVTCDVYGRAPTALVLDTIKHGSGSDVQTAVDALMSFLEDEAICMYDSGDSNVKIGAGSGHAAVVAAWLHTHGVEHVSVVSGGFEAIHTYAVERGIELADHLPSRCPICDLQTISEPVEEPQQPRQPVLAQMRKRIGSVAKAVGESALSSVKMRTTSMTIRQHTPEPIPADTAPSYAEAAAIKAPNDAFCIDDTDSDFSITGPIREEEEESEDEEPIQLPTKDDMRGLEVPISSFGDDVLFFGCRMWLPDVKPNKGMFASLRATLRKNRQSESDADPPISLERINGRPCHLIVTNQQILCAIANPNRLDLVIIICSHHLRSLAKATLNKRFTKVFSLVFADAEELVVEKYEVSDVAPLSIINSIRHRVEALTSGRRATVV